MLTRCLFGLAGGGVYPAAPVTGRAVRSYRTVSPLPVMPRTTSIGGLFSVALSLASLPVAVSHHRALPSSDFPPGGRAPGRPPSPLCFTWIVESFTGQGSSLSPMFHLGHRTRGTGRIGIGPDALRRFVAMARRNLDESRGAAASAAGVGLCRPGGDGYIGAAADSGRCSIRAESAGIGPLRRS